MSLAEIVHWWVTSMSVFYARAIRMGVKLSHVKRFLRKERKKFFKTVVIWETLFLKCLPKYWWRIGMNIKRNNVFIFLLCERMFEEPIFYLHSKLLRAWNIVFNRSWKQYHIASSRSGLKVTVVLMAFGNLFVAQICIPEVCGLNIGRLIDWGSNVLTVFGNSDSYLWTPEFDLKFQLSWLKFKIFPCQLFQENDGMVSENASTPRFYSLPVSYSKHVPAFDVK
jgi:hypothetical protein